MGRRKSIVKQVKDELQAKAAWGRSKHADKAAAKAAGRGANGEPLLDRIYSHNTMKGYIDAAVRFAKWVRNTYGCKDIGSARQYAGEYLEYRISKDYSAWTVYRDAAAIAKLYNVRSTELGVKLPARHRGDITQHRRDTNGSHFSEGRNRDLVDLCCGTGLRRHEVAALRPQNVTREPDGGVTVHVEQGKGGRSRDVPVLPSYADRVFAIASKAAAAGQGTIIT